MSGVDRALGDWEAAAGALEERIRPHLAELDDRGEPLGLRQEDLDEIAALRRAEQGKRLGYAWALIREGLALPLGLLDDLER